MVIRETVASAHFDLTTAWAGRGLTLELTRQNTSLLFGIIIMTKEFPKRFPTDFQSGGSPAKIIQKKLSLGPGVNICPQKESLLLSSFRKDCFKNTSACACLNHSQGPFHHIFLLLVTTVVGWEGGWGRLHAHEDRDQPRLQCGKKPRVRGVHPPPYPPYHITLCDGRTCYSSM